MLSRRGRGEPGVPRKCLGALNWHEGSTYQHDSDTTVCSSQIYAYDVAKVLPRALRPQWFLVVSLCVGVTQECERTD